MLGGGANFCRAFATKRYRSNCINWGILPLTTKEEDFPFETGDWILLKDVRAAVEQGKTEIEATAITKDGASPLPLELSGLTDKERQILIDGCLMNYYMRRNRT